jgi:hypothetical protein
MIQNYDKITKVLATSLGLTSEELVRSYNRATVADIAAICELMCLGFGVVENLSPEVIAWRYFNFSKNISDIFVLRYKGHLIGAVGAEPINVKVGDKEYQGVRAADIVVHPDHGKRGIGFWMNLHLQYSFPIVMAMGSNDKSDTMVRRLFKPVNCRHHFKMLFSVKGYFAVRKWQPIALSIVTLLAALPLAISRKIFLKSLPQGYSSTTSETSEGLESFFNNPDYHPPKTNIALRSAEFCRWRYDLNPKSQFTILQLHYQNTLIGYSVIKKEPSTLSKDWQLMDWDLLPHLRDQNHLRILFSSAIKSALDGGAHSLSVLASDELSCTSLRKTGFSQRAVDDGFFLWAQDSVPRDVLDEKQWFLSLCDTDESL